MILTRFVRETVKVSEERLHEVGNLLLRIEANVVVNL